MMLNMTVCKTRCTGDCKTYAPPLNACYNPPTLWPGDEQWGTERVIDTCNATHISRSFFAAMDVECTTRTDGFDLPLGVCLGPFGKPRPWGTFACSTPSSGAATAATTTTTKTRKSLTKFRELELVPPQVSAPHEPTPVDPTSMIGLTLLGYQGWFATPGDDDNNGWVHWGKLANGTGIMEDYWPQMDEFSAAEKHIAPGYVHLDGSQAYVFSSDNAATVTRHFQWMEAYGIDGVAVQRFGVEVGAVRHKRVLNYSLAAAVQTGRVLYVEYDLSGMKETDIVETLRSDWAALVADGVTTHPRYVHHEGRPVVGIFGFYMNRFSATTAAEILNIFSTQPGLEAFVAGSGQWFWWKDEPTPAWSKIFYRMGSWSPWNMVCMTVSSPSTYISFLFLPVRARVAPMPHQNALSFFSACFLHITFTGKLEQRRHRPSRDDELLGRECEEFH